MKNKHNRFELTLILDPKLKGDEIKNVIKKIKQLIIKNKGIVVSVEEKGIMNFATPIKKNTSGFYFFIQFEIEKNQVKNIEWEYRYNRAVLRYLLINLTKEKYYFQQLEINKAKEKFYKEEEKKISIQEAATVGTNVEFKFNAISEKVKKPNLEKDKLNNKILKNITKDDELKEKIIEKKPNIISSKKEDPLNIIDDKNKQIIKDLKSEDNSKKDKIKITNETE